MDSTDRDPSPTSSARPLPGSGDTGLPLAGLLVADFSRVLAGPMVTMTLADLGATVVKVERPGSGDETRSWGPPWTASSSSYFEAANRSKLSAALDLAVPEDLQLARELTRRADILVENFRVGTMDRFGLGFDDVRADNPEIVYCSVTGYGSGGGAALPGYDFIVQAVGGLMSITGEADSEPVKVGVAVVDVMTAKDAVIGILAALRARDLTGRGQRVEVNLLSSLLGSLANQASGFLATGSSPTRMGNQHPSIAPYETLRCRDGMLAVACGNDAQFARLAAAVGIPEAAVDARFASNAARVLNRPALVRLLEAQLLGEDAQTWEQRLVHADVPAGQVGDIASGFAHAEALGLAPTREVGGGSPPQVAHPISYSAMTPRPPVAPPALGAHDELVRGWLRDDEGTVAGLTAQADDTGART